MTIERDPVRGCYVVSAVVRGQLETRRYYGYTRAEAVALFWADVRRARRV